ncbi:phage tail sheath family protein [Mariniphaga sediminis]|uniref:Phage tail sheath family protein n=1 Tax=Mariniphaga sediminis TaxID=1628158 RepID=A0A399D3P8_9BACT|nr:phage tail sheath C-terminal domain-containing protein [Mariniphaga sediminis]RIH65351.1 phage tail sheath family protein [Mariniphaga sediminis]
MATAYKTPGVYVEEISKFPPSVAQVETAIPAFVGYTEMALIEGVDYHDEGIIKPIKIGSLPEYEFFFGGAPKPTTVEIELNTDNSVKRAKVNGVNLLYDSVRMFYANGGGDCYIVSVGSYNSLSSDVDKQELLDGLASLEKEDLPTLLVIPESVHLSAAEAGEVHAAMLAQCNKLQDRFAVLDMVDGEKEITPTTDPVADFRDNVGMNYLKYGAAYYPWIRTTLPFKIDYDSIVGGTYTKGGAAVPDITALFNSDIVTAIDNIDTDIAAESSLTAPSAGTINNRGLLETYANDLYGYAKDFFDLTFTDNDTNDQNSAASIHAKFVVANSNFHGLLKTLFDYNHFSQAANSDAPSPAWDNALISDDFTADFNPLTFAAPATDANDIFTATSTAANAAPYFTALGGKLIKLVSDFYTELEASRANRTETLQEVDGVYKGIVNAISNQGVVLPASGAAVGIYAMVDNERGVWKAPANVSITAVKGPTVNVTHEDQESLNVDTVAGKSVNAIRAFTGKGTLIWGARTLAGNDNEWRYVSVRRFFNMVEESVKKASSQFVFEPNDANTWVKVRAMIENFLTLQWRAGALAGAKQEHAFYVRVGLGQTMTAQDILNGYMNVEIGMAVVRPAEFIILKFSHKMQES